MKFGFLSAILACAFMLSVHAADKPAKLQVFMAGDSTMSIKEAKDLPETGWGMPFAVFFDEQTVIDNRAMNGRSTRTFIEEGRWASILDALTAGDVVFIQFGHNDASETKPDRYTTPKQYQQNLTRFITDVRSKKAQPILLSPITRRYFNAQGVIEPTHPYAELVRDVAKQTGVTFIDMEAITRDYFTNQGKASSSLRFLHLPANTHPNYPNGVTDNTHLSELGAREVAQLVLRELRRVNHPLVQRLRTPDPKHLTFSAQAE